MRSAAAAADWFIVAVLVLGTVPEVDNAPLPCKPWNDDARLIKHELMSRLMAERSTSAPLSRVGAKLGQPYQMARPSFDLAIITSSRPRALALSYFGVTAGSLVGQGVFTGTVRVSYNGAIDESGYIETTASLLGFQDRLMVQRLPTDVLEKANMLDKSEPIDKSYHKMAANYIQALGPQHLDLNKISKKSKTIDNGSIDGGGSNNGRRGGGDGGDGRSSWDSLSTADEISNENIGGDGSFATSTSSNDAAEIPLVVLEDDVLVAAHFEPRLERLLRGLRRALPKGTRFILSLYMAYDAAARAQGEAEPVAPGIVKYPPGWFYATQGIVFSDSQVRRRFVKFYLSKCLNVPLGWNEGRQKATCDGSDMVMQMFLQAISKVHDPRNQNFLGNAAIGTAGDRIELFGVQHALVQHLSKSNHTTVGAASQPHRVQNYVDSRVPCKRFRKGRNRRNPS